MIINIEEKKTFANNKSSKQYILVINRCDFYSMFCINRVFKDFNLNFTVVKNGDIATIYIDTDDKDIALDVVNGLKNIIFIQL